MCEQITELLKRLPCGKRPPSVRTMGVFLMEGKNDAYIFS